MTLVLENVGKVVGGETHIEGLNLELEPGSFNVLLGRTLAGKTTTMRMMAGLDQPTSGRIVHNGEDVTEVSVRKRSVAMVYQQFINYPSMTVRGNIAAPLKLAGVSKAEIERRVRETAELMGMEALLDRYPSELSGGQQQRCAMARALVREADLILLDEPLLNLDYKLREQMREELRNILSERDSVVVYATTEPVEALTLGGSTAILHEGRLLQYGSTIGVYHYPATIPVAQVFNDPPMNLIPATVDGQRLQLADGHDLPLPEHLGALSSGSYQIGIRPHHLERDMADESRLDIAGACELTEIMGSTSYVHLHEGGYAWVAQLDGVHDIAYGNRVELSVAPRHLYAFHQDGRLAVAPVSAHREGN